MKKVILLLCLALLMTSLLTACVGTNKPETTAAPTTEAPTEVRDPDVSEEWSALAGKGKVGTVLPDFSVATADGGQFRLSEALESHELVLINLWATWCPPCNMEFPFLEEAYRSYQDRVAVIALSVEETDTLEVMREHAKNKGLSFPLAQDENYVLSTTFNVSGIPTSLLVDRSRTVIWMEVGAKASVEEFNELFDTYLEGGSTAGKSSYTVTVVDQNGDPVPGCVVNFCTEESCVPVIADESGIVSFSGEPYAYHLQVLSVPEGYDYTGSDDLFVKAEGDSLTVTLTKLG